MTRNDDATRPDPESRAAYMRQIYIDGLQSGATPITTKYPILRSQAKKKLTQGAFDYVDGSAGTETSYRTNASEFRRWQIVPRMLAGVDIHEFDMAVQAFGRWYPTPLVISPIGVQGQLHAEADCATAKAARSLQVPFTLSSAASRPLEQVATEAGYAQGDDDAAPGQEAWFQLYWPSDEEVTASVLRRAKAAGYKVLVVTLDTWMLGWRPRDLDSAYNPFLRADGVANLHADPVFVEKYCDGKSPLSPDATPDEVLAACTAFVGLINSGQSRSWSELAQLREMWGEGPIVLKGIMCLEDAKLVVEHGMDGVWVSNHGGRQVDGSAPALKALEGIAPYLAQVGAAGRRWGKPVCIFDSGVRTGADVFKAKALGADLVGIGRPYAWGLSVAGEEGVEAVLKSLLADFELSAALAGCRSVDEVQRHRLVRDVERL